MSNTQNARSHHEPDLITIPRPEAARPAYMPLDESPWRLVDPSGSMLRDSDGYSLRFHTDTEALHWLQIHNIPLLRGHHDIR